MSVSSLDKLSHVGPADCGLAVEVLFFGASIQTVRAEGTLFSCGGGLSSFRAARQPRSWKPENAATGWGCHHVALTPCQENLEILPESTIVEMPRVSAICQPLASSATLEARNKPWPGWGQRTTNALQDFATNSPRFSFLGQLAVRLFGRMANGVNHLNFIQDWNRNCWKRRHRSET